ncbi:MFS transporter [Vagococcus xieshaowenii]|uniref:MFS transporter n=1 Tax=Vagococcus xieshaowenii TaxID=2562451 RepID=UPI001432653A|nr:MFS transporter [Vagococcus xieshaowenii]
MLGKNKSVFGIMSVIQGLYWIIFCSVSGFATVYMLDRGINDGEVGTIIAVACFISVFVQFGSGFIIEKIPKLTLKRMIVGSTCLMALINILLMLFHESNLVIGTLYCIAVILLYNIQPLMTSLVYEYDNAGYHVSFSVTRGIGSGAYALTSFLLGGWLAKHSSLTIPIVTILASLLLLSLLFALPKIEEVPKEMVVNKLDDSKSSNRLLKRYPSLLPLIIAIALVFTFHNLVNVFLPQIISSVNGGQSQIGYAIAIASAVEIPVMFGFQWLEKKFNVRNLLLISVVFFLIRSVLYLIAGSFTQIIPVQLLQMFSFALITPAYAHYINLIMDEKDNVKGQSFVMAALTFGNVVGSFVGGQIITHYGVKTMLAFGVVVMVLGVLSMFYSMKVDKNCRTQ